MKISKSKSFVFGLAFLGSMGFGGLAANGQASVDPPEGGSELRWRQLFCPSTGSFYEICFLTGDGSLCSSWGDTTRSCT